MVFPVRNSQIPRACHFFSLSLVPLLNRQVFQLLCHLSSLSVDRVRDHLDNHHLNLLVNRRVNQVDNLLVGLRRIPANNLSQDLVPNQAGNPFLVLRVPLLDNPQGSPLCNPLQSPQVLRPLSLRVNLRCSRRVVLLRSLPAFLLVDLHGSPQANRLDNLQLNRRLSLRPVSPLPRLHWWPTLKGRASPRRVLLCILHQRPPLNLLPLLRFLWRLSGLAKCRHCFRAWLLETLLVVSWTESRITI